MKFYKLSAIIGIPLSFSSVVFAEQAIYSTSTFSGDMSLGSLSGKTRERVYDPDEGGRKNSQLNWKFSNAAVIKSVVTWDVLPQLSVAASGWTTLSSRGGYMDDTDWSDSSEKNWTDQSRHPDTRLKFANEFDINMTGWVINKQDYRIGVIAGYQEIRYSFEASGGSYDYTDEDTGQKDKGSFPDGERSIGYKQRYKTPYIGMTGNYRYHNFELSGTFKYSDWVHTSDNDEHYARNTTFKAKIKNQRYFSLTGNAGYYVTSNMKLFLESTWSRTTNKKGSLSSYDYETGEKDSAEDSSGIENYSFMTSAGLKYIF